jgi:hypothetical protein
MNDLINFPRPCARIVEIHPRQWALDKLLHYPIQDKNNKNAPMKSNTIFGKELMHCTEERKIVKNFANQH